MTRIASFALGLLIGSASVAATLIWLWPGPRLHMTLDWSPLPTRTAPGRPSAFPGPPQPVLTSQPRAELAPRATVAPTATPAAHRPAPLATPEPVASALPTIGSALLPGSPIAVTAPSLLIPVAGIKAIGLYDTFNQARGGERRHEAIDIMAPRGTPVLAAGDGKLVKLFTSQQGGLTLYQFDPSATYAYYYAHLDGYEPGLVEGSELKRGDVIGRVGSTGNANAEGPHLHFAVLLLGPERRWWEGVAVNPYPLLEK